MIHHGDCLEVMAAMEPESLDAIVTDPPYGLEFMGKEWDGPKLWRDGANRRDKKRDREMELGYSKKIYGSVDERSPSFYNLSPKHLRWFQEWNARWAEAAYRVAKPSAYLLAFGGTRTVHRMTVALEDAGWIIRDMLVWAYASGFPKSKASLKPAWEPIVMARKPGPLRDLAIDACRIEANYAEEYGETWLRSGRQAKPDDGWQGPPEKAAGSTVADRISPLGRWPANVILTDPIFDGGIEGVVGGGEAGDFTAGRYRREDETEGMFGFGGRYRDDNVYGDSGTYSRFFLIPKADRAEREPIGGMLPQKRRTMGSGLTGVSGDRSGRGGEARPIEAGAATRANHHPTVKPVDLMRHLVRLVTPSGGVVLDPFLGSGTTGIACEMEGFDWIGIEREAEYVRIAEARLVGVQRGFGLSA